MHRALLVFFGIALLIVVFQPMARETEVYPGSVPPACAVPQGVQTGQTGESRARFASSYFLLSEQTGECAEGSSAQRMSGDNAKPEAGRWSQAELTAFFVVVGVVLLWMFFICGTLVRSSRHLEDTIEINGGSDGDHMGE